VVSKHFSGQIINNFVLSNKFSPIYRARAKSLSVVRQVSMGEWGIMRRAMLKEEILIKILVFFSGIPEKKSFC
jgi:hypothetical protein